MISSYLHLFIYLFIYIIYIYRKNIIYIYIHVPEEAGTLGCRCLVRCKRTSLLRIRARAEAFFTCSVQVVLASASEKSESQKPLKPDSPSHKSSTAPV